MPATQGLFLFSVTILITTQPPDIRIRHLHTEFQQKIGQSTDKLSRLHHFHMATVRYIKFGCNWVLSITWPRVRFYTRTKFGADVAIRGRGMSGKRNSK